MKTWIRIFLQSLTFFVMGGVAVFALLTGAFFYVEPTLPDAAELRNVQFQIPMSIYSRDGRLMQQYGEQKRTPIAYEEIPALLKQAFLAAEDDRFFEHSGIDYAGILRGAIFLVTNPGERAPGGSTITQQVSRTANLVSRDYSFVRKFKEVLLAFRIEREFTKEEIFGLFLNTTFFGQRANGIASAAQTYFNKELDELTLSEVAIIAGIPQGPSIMNPYNSPENAASRRAYVLRRMLELGHIDRTAHDAALAEVIVSQRFGLETELSADYVAQMAYEWAVARFGKEVADSAGLNVITTVDSRLQAAANDALRAALDSYDRNHGYRGPVANVDLAAIAGNAGSAGPAAGTADYLAALDDVLTDYPEQFDSEAAVVVAVNEVFADVYLRSGGLVSLGLDAMSWARPYINDDRQGPRPELVTDVLSAGDIVRFRRNADGGLELFQIPVVEGALVSVDPMDGAVVALVGGYSFQRNAFNRVTQAGRQPGSSFKPFFYLSALANGYTLASIVNDAPFVEHSTTLETTRAVVNYGGVYHGEIPLRFALTESLNAAADRIVRDILPRNSIRYLERFGFGPDALPNNTSLALGSGSVTPLELAGAYSILANGGYSVGIQADDRLAPAPYFIDRIEDIDGNVLYDAGLSVEMVCAEPEPSADQIWPHDESALIERPSDLFPPLRCAQHVESPQRIYLITDVMKDVVKFGSGARAGRAFPGRNDLAGKTGTTTGPRDAWFAGFNADIVAVVRVGFDDDTRELGQGEQGGRTAIPAWIDFMRVALDGTPDHALPRPPGIVERRIDPATGLIAADCNLDADWEMFLIENQPDREPDTFCPSSDASPTQPDEQPSTSPLFL